MFGGRALGQMAGFGWRAHAGQTYPQSLAATLAPNEVCAQSLTLRPKGLHSLHMPHLGPFVLLSSFHFTAVQPSL